ncbi:MAG: universal stress protein [Candidatus Lokiarchaeota archaeon]|nr:universal stress protein [Candidatus Lokiarchaeota archaeon]
MYKKILVGVDGSDHGAKALREAVKLAQKFKAELHVFHAIRHHYHLPMFPLGFNAPYLANPFTEQFSEERMQQIYEESGKQVIEQAKQQVEAMNLPIEGEILYHLETNISPVEYVKTHVMESGMDLVVVGCEGHHSRARTALMGTVAMDIINNAPCQVLVVR